MDVTFVDRKLVWHDGVCCRTRCCARWAHHFKTLLLEMEDNSLLEVACEFRLGCREASHSNLMHKLNSSFGELGGEAAAM